MSHIPFSRKELYDFGTVRRFKGSAHPEVAFPVGGIGTGTVSLGARGELRDWEIFLRPNKGFYLPYGFFAVRAQIAGSKAVTKVLEGRPGPPYIGSHGYLKNATEGLPRFDDTEFVGEYPLAQVNFIDRGFPVKVSMEVFNPFIPLNPDDSGIPAVIFLVTVKNGRKKPARVSLALSLLNACGYDSVSKVNRMACASFGKNVNRVVTKGELSGLYFTTKKFNEDDSRFGSMAAITNWKSVTARAAWKETGWWGDLHTLWNDFDKDGRLTGKAAKTRPTDDGYTDFGSICLSAHVRPGKSVTFPLVLSWCFPNMINYWDARKELKNRLMKKYYSTQFRNAFDAGRYVFDNFERLEKGTRQFHKALFSSTLPAHVLDAVSSQMSTLRTTTCFRLADGRFYGFEGSSENAGCCPMNCTHVWNYEQALAHLFPSLARTMRETDFLINVEPDGTMAFRTAMPPGIIKKWDFHPAADGQMGTIIRLYREWKLSGDNSFLKRLWPKAQKALEYAWRQWDRDKDGLMEGQQHNTYDIEFYGPNTVTGLFYLGALKAGAEMARAMGDEESAATYEKLLKRGVKKTHELLWNGKYYIQKFDARKHKRNQYGKGCLSDQLLGQWLAEVSGLGEILGKGKVRKALTSIFRYNFRDSLLNHRNTQRTYALDDEKGLLVCTWPLGGRPRLPFIYCDEVWTGIEYHVASHMMYEGLIDEGLAIVKGARDRHDGRRRNPWNEPECGNHYVRAMSSWSLLTALSGFSYDGTKKSIRFGPKIRREDFKCFFSTGTCWGEYRQRSRRGNTTISVRVLYGELHLDAIRLCAPSKRHGHKDRIIRFPKTKKIKTGRSFRAAAAAE
jgi:uncharacterized protein (DUF608 family)